MDSLILCSVENNCNFSVKCSDSCGTYHDNDKRDNISFRAHVEQQSAKDTHRVLSHKTKLISELKVPTAPPFRRSLNMEIDADENKDLQIEVFLCSGATRGALNNITDNSHGIFLNGADQTLIQSPLVRSPRVADFSKYFRSLAISDTSIGAVMREASSECTKDDDSSPEPMVLSTSLQQKIHSSGPVIAKIPVTSKNKIKNIFKRQKKG